MPARTYRTKAAREAQQEAQGQALSRMLERCLQVKLCVSEAEPKPEPPPQVCLVQVIDPDKLAELQDGAGLDAGLASNAFNTGMGLLAQISQLALKCHEKAMAIRKQRARDPCASISEIYTDDELGECAQVPEIAHQICAMQSQLLGYAAQFTYVSNQILAQIEWCCFPLSMQVADGGTSTNDGAGTQDQSDTAKSE